MKWKFLGFAAAAFLSLRCSQTLQSGGNEVGNGGTSAYLPVEHGLVHAGLIIDRLHEASLPRSARDAATESHVNWFFQNREKLKTALKEMELEWVDELSSFCPQSHIWACHRTGTPTVYVARKQIPSGLTYKEAAFTLIHESVHVVGEANEGRAHAAALIAAATWVNMGHPEAPHWFNIAESPTTAERLQQDPLLTSFHYSDYDGESLVVWDERLFQRYSPKKDEWTLERVETNDLHWKRGRTNLGQSAHRGFWIQEQGVVVVPCADNYESLSGKGFAARLDAKAREWKLVTNVGAPSQRSHAGLAKSATHLFVWGGRRCETEAVSLNDGGMYSPVDDSWTPIPGVSPNSPKARLEHGMAWTGQKLAIWGGYGVFQNADGAGSADYLNDGALYDPKTQTWEPLVPSGDVPAARVGATLIASTGKLFIVGGSAEFNRPPERDIYSYDLKQGTWEKLPPAPKALQFNYFHLVHAFWTGSQLAIVTPRGAFFYSTTEGTWRESKSAHTPSYREGSRLYWTGLEAILWDPAQRLGFALYP